MSEIYATSIIIALLTIQLGTFFLLIFLKQIFRNLSEKLIIRIVANMTLASILMIISLTIFVISHHEHFHIFNLGTWFKTFDGKYEIIFIIDYLSVIYSLFSMVMIGVVIIFSRRYMHKDAGYFRFYSSMTLFAFGVNLISFAGTMEITIIGWEFVGLSSVLLVSFFNYRAAPVKNAFWVFVNYRICDIGLFAAVLLMHAAMHNSHFQTLTSGGWLGISAEHAPIFLGFLILFGAMGKSALFPLSGWLPRAMEGPTPSSAIFYGSISVHFGPFLLLRSANLIAASPSLALAIIAIGAITAIVARLVAHAQTDVKSSIAYESVMQIGIIVVEIGLGWNVVAVIHIVGHSCFRTMQMLRAPSVIHDLRNIEQMLGHSLATFVVSKKYDHKDYAIYRFLLERGCMDNLVKDNLIRCILWPFHQINSLEEKWRGLLTKSFRKKYD